MSRLFEARRRRRAALVTSQAQPFRLRPDLLTTRVGHSCRRTPCHSGGNGRAPPSGTRSLGQAIGRRAVSLILDWAPRGNGGEDGTDPAAVGRISFRRRTARPTLPPEDGPGGQTYLSDAPVGDDPHAHVHNLLSTTKRRPQSSSSTAERPGGPRRTTPGLPPRWCCNSKRRKRLVSRRNASPGRAPSSSSGSRCFLRLPGPR
jgi:hypothetical protein